MENGFSYSTTATVVDRSMLDEKAARVKLMVVLPGLVESDPTFEVPMWLDVPAHAADALQTGTAVGIHLPDFDVAQIRPIPA